MNGIPTTTYYRAQTVYHCAFATYCAALDAWTASSIYDQRDKYGRVKDALAVLAIAEGDLVGFASVRS